MRTFSTTDDQAIEQILEDGEAHVPPPRETVYLLTVNEPFEVVSDVGTLTGESGDAVGLAGRRLFLVKAEELAAYKPGEVGSKDDEDEDEDGEKAHKHEWEAGILPGNKRVKTCRGCGEFEEISNEEWNKVKQQQKPPGQRLAAPGRNYA